MLGSASRIVLFLYSHAAMEICYEVHTGDLSRVLNLNCVCARYSEMRYCNQKKVQNVTFLMLWDYSQ